jgi:AcrR family transcriptional regulator
MARRNDHSREELREMALTATRGIVESEGIQKLTTRSVAKCMGYSVGTLYLIFHNLDDLIFAVNAQTVGELRAAIAKNLANRTDPVERLRATGRAYLDYALANPNLWRLALEHQPPADTRTPKAITDETDRILDAVLDDLQALRPNDDAEDLLTTAAAFWSGVHGVCHLTLSDTIKFAKVQSIPAVLERQVDAFIRGCQL